VCFSSAAERFPSGGEALLAFYDFLIHFPDRKNILEFTLYGGTYVGRR
jgi:hypothetical protein